MHQIKIATVHLKNKILCIPEYCNISRAWYEMEWNGNFGMEYGRCQNGMEDNLAYFHTNSKLNFAHGIYRKKYTDNDNQNMRKRIAANHLSTNY